MIRRISSNSVLVCFLIGVNLFFSCGNQEEFQFAYKDVSVSFNEGVLVVANSRMERVWQQTENGLVTQSITDKHTDRQWRIGQSTIKCDWAYFGLVDDTTEGKLLSINASQSNDDGYTSDHLQIELEFEYPSVETFVKYVVWAYPETPGLRTQVFIKGKAEQYIQATGQRKQEDIEFEIVSGKFQKGNYQASAIAESYITNMLRSDSSIQIHVKGLKQHKAYQLGFSWWDYSGEGLVQQVRATSVDGEQSIVLQPKMLLPDYKNEHQKHQTIIVDLPSSLLIDGTCRVYFESINGSNAVVSELMIYEIGDTKSQVSSGLVERLDELKNNSPTGYHLKGYLDCGPDVKSGGNQATGRVDYLPVFSKTASYKSIGYFNDTQHRNKPETPIIKEQEDTYWPNKVNWASILQVEDQSGDGVLMIKESNKTANQYGVDTGEFELSDAGIQNTGTSLFATDITSEGYQWCWASWSVLYSGANDGAELAIKAFDRARYPVDPARDIYIQANTWGSGSGKNGSKEDNVLKELESQQALGIDIQQIDDGWQDKKWNLREDWYPNGWSAVVEKAQSTGVKLGLWGAAMPIPLESLKQHYDAAGFVSYKLDFARLNDHKSMVRLIGKVRSFIDYTGHKVRVNWDVTENAARFGYYWAKEYGCVYLENRKPDKPANVVYIPHLVLRDIWHVAKYTNINKFQTTIQNTEVTNQKVSDAMLHDHPYAVAIGLIGTPLFFQETQLYSSEARDQIRPLLDIYKMNRTEMYDQYVFPIGDEPNNASWTGFQWYHPEKKQGYLMIFRELENDANTQDVSLKFLADQNLRLTDLQTNTTREVRTDKNGMVGFQQDTPASFQFLKYEIR
ncbi:MAG: hypothetical protein ABJN36_03250 [Cyclobacteriaceae bacterium]